MSDEGNCSKCKTVIFDDEPIYPGNLCELCGIEANEREDVL